MVLLLVLTSKTNYEQSYSNIALFPHICSMEMKTFNSSLVLRSNGVALFKPPCEYYFIVKY